MACLCYFPPDSGSYLERCGSQAIQSILAYHAFTANLTVLLQRPDGMCMPSIGQYLTPAQNAPQFVGRDALLGRDYTMFAT